MVLSLLVSLLAVSFGVVGGEAHALDCAGVDTSVIDCSQSGESNGIWALLITVINIMTGGVGILAVAGLVYGSIMYSTAEGDPGKVSKAREIIRNVVIGLIMFAAMYALLNFIIPGGIFNS